MAGKPIRGAGGDIAGRIRSLGTAMEREQPKTLRKALDKAKAEQDRQIRRDSGGDMRLSGVNKAKGRPGNAKVGSRLKVTAGSRLGEIAAVGPLQIINNDTAGRVIRSAYAKSRSANKRKGTSARGFVGPIAPGQIRGDAKAVLNIPGVGFRRSARHPGTTGKKTWQVGRKAAEPKIRAEMNGNTTAALARAMKG